MEIPRWNLLCLTNLGSEDSMASKLSQRSNASQPFKKAKPDRVKGSATSAILQGRPHGLCTRLKDQVNRGLLEFFERAERVAA
jgi:hypothetical protein